jgi:hypothetical protein
MAIGTNPLAPVKQINTVYEKLKFSGDRRVGIVDLHVLSAPTDFGCASHPSVTGHQKMAQRLISAIDALHVFS